MPESKRLRRNVGRTGVVDDDDEDGLERPEEGGEGTAVAVPTLGNSI